MTFTSDDLHAPITCENQRVGADLLQNAQIGVHGEHALQLRLDHVQHHVSAFLLLFPPRGKQNALQVGNAHLHAETPQAVDGARKAEHEQEGVLPVLIRRNGVGSGVEVVREVAELRELEGRVPPGRKVDEQVVVLLQPAEEHLPRVLPPLDLLLTPLLHSHQNQGVAGRVLNMCQYAAAQLDALSLILKTQIESDGVVKAFGSVKRTESTVNIYHIVEENELKLQIVQRGGIPLEVLLDGWN